MAKRWRIQPHDLARVARLERAASVSPIIAQLLLARGIEDPSQARGFLEAKLVGLRDPDLLPGVKEAAARILAAAQAKQRIVVYGDYDVDGMSATAILVRCLQLLGANVGYHVPNRLEEGYGLSSEALTRLAERGARTVISVDCGITSVAEATTARDCGLELIITDHHEPGPQLPNASAIVHPRLPGHNYPFGGLCGAGVALKLAWALCRMACGTPKVSERLQQFLISAVGLASLGTVADVVPLIDENRILVKRGLVSLRDAPVTGISALLSVTKLDEKSELGSDDIGFTLAPRLNAAGRLGQAELAVELLTTENPERARALAEYIHELNSSRDSLERKIFKAAHEQAEEEFDPVGDAGLVLAGRGWHVGVIGIVAGRLAERYNRPVVLLSLDEFGAKPAVGSCRSAAGLNLHRALAACSHHLLGFGGHAAAAGLRMEEARIAAFREEFCEYALRATSPEERVAEVRVDAEASLAQLTSQVVDAIEQMAPFGCGNPRPILAATGVNLAEPPKRMGQGERHLSCTVEQFGKRMRAVGFGHAEWVDAMVKAGGPFDIAFKPVINEFRGMRNVELHLVDWRPSAVAAELAGT